MAKVPRTPCASLRAHCVCATTAVGVREIQAGPRVRLSRGYGPFSGARSIDLVENRHLISHAEAEKILRRAGYPPARIEEALRHLPDPIDLERDANELAKYGVSRGRLIERMGGSP